MTGSLGFRCRGFRCFELCTGKDRYCPKCADQAPKPFARKHVEKLKFYDTARWSRIRRMKLAQNPVCEVCNRNLAEEVHHLQTARDHPELRFTLSNLQSICGSCHKAESARESHEQRRKTE